MTHAQILSKLTFGLCYHAFYQDQSSVVKRNRHMLVFKLQYGNLEHVIVMSLKEFYKYECFIDYVLPENATVILPEDEEEDILSLGDVCRFSVPYGEGTRDSILFKVNVCNEDMLVKLPPSAYEKCLERSKRLLPILGECLNIPEAESNTFSKLVYFVSEDEETGNQTYAVLNGHAYVDAKEYIVWDDDDLDQLLDCSCVCFDDLSLNVVDTPEEEQEDKEEKVKFKQVIINLIMKVITFFSTKFGRSE